jgi:hypothetical protein
MEIPKNALAIFGFPKVRLRSDDDFTILSFASK